MTHDSEANAAYICLVEKIDRGEVARSCVADIPMDNAAITIDFDAEGRVLGIEVLGASQALRAETIRQRRKSLVRRRPPTTTTALTVNGSRQERVPHVAPVSCITSDVCH
jgi:uncharacterized protein YuzE